MRFEENVEIYEKYDKIYDIPYGSQVELKVGEKSYITGTYQGLCGGFAIDISGNTYSLSQIQEIKVNITKEENLKLGDIVEIINIEGLNRVLYSNYPKGFSKKLIGLQGKITMIDKFTTKGITYYLVDFSVGNPRIHDIRYFVDSRAIFLEENLRLVKEYANKVDNSKFFNPSDIKTLNYKDLDGKTLKMTVVDNEECLLVAGVDKETNTIYILHSEVK